MTGIEYVERFKFSWEFGTENSVFVGAHAQGKTYAAAQLIALPLLGNHNHWVWDYHGRVFDELVAAGLTPRQSQLLNASRVKLLSDVGAGTQFLWPYIKDDATFLKFCELACKQHDLHVTVDELHNYNTAHRISHELARLMRDMGNRNVSYTAILQRPAENHKSVISNATHIFVFKLPLHTDVNYLRRWVGVEVELLLQPEFRRFFKNEPELPQYSFIYKDVRAMHPVVVVGGLK